ncbi:uncharacterized protein LOC123272528 [Cotesia glomerata]|uniref:Uncharacterized protein n=1 Tax=Cotesia glomerata TaxID=32391 RepID=A0AAV7J633_COTGL|nr:uncharacterized protein LOC123272528 [Cotesia glomerata]KAH0564607.1 hypothetical protein KQX54_013057 [Cotesia glomerata]
MATVKLSVVMAITLNMIYNFGCDGFPTVQKTIDTIQAPAVNDEYFINQHGIDLFQLYSNEQPGFEIQQRSRRDTTKESNSNTETEEHHQGSSKFGIGIGILGKPVASFETSKSHLNNKWSSVNHTSRATSSSRFLGFGKEQHDTNTEEETKKESENDESKESGVKFGLFGFESAKIGTRHSSSSHDFMRNHQGFDHKKITFTTEKSLLGNIMPCCSL